jgi:two-component system CheB/CheR fusion protein
VGKEETGSRAELHFRLLERFGPPSVLVDRNHEIQHLSQNAGRFLQVNAGEPTTDLLRLINPALRVELRSALFRAAQTGQPAESLRVPLELEAKLHEVDIRVIPAGDIAPEFLAVAFDARALGGPLDPALPAPAGGGPREPLIQHLEREIEHLKTHLRDTIEQNEASTEELKASNEELQAMNEELRSATEELETSREELQSINEELTTVNQELKEKVEELAHANSDLQNLMGATAIATLFLDREMRIMRFTDSAIPLFHLIPSDTGRPLSNLQHEIDYPDIATDAASVLARLTPIERQVTGAGGKHYLARMLPYRTMEDRIAGVVLTLVDITERQCAVDALREHVEELKRFNNVAVGRESRMVELKKEINKLCVRLGEKPRFPLNFEPDKP